jgi:flagellar biogenesis protein FliO
MQFILAFAQVVISLGVVLFLAYYSLHNLLPRLQAGRMNLDSAMQVLEWIPVGMRCHLCLVKVGEQYFLIGVSAQSVQYLAEIPADSLPEKKATGWQQSDFSAILEKSMARAQSTWRQVHRQLRPHSDKKRGTEDEE